MSIYIDGVEAPWCPVCNMQYSPKNGHYCNGKVLAPVTVSVPTNPLPTDATARKSVKLYTGLIKYFPDALAAVATLSVVASLQHHPGEPVHWERDKSNDHYDCIARHLWEADSFDTDGQRHTAKVAWRALAALQLEIERDRSKG